MIFFKNMDVDPFAHFLANPFLLPNESAFLNAP